MAHDKLCLTDCHRSQEKGRGEVTEKGHYFWADLVLVWKRECTKNARYEEQAFFSEEKI